ncbi:MAG: hypothetical protein VW462_00330 [Rhodospirillales bacterium]
MMPAPALIFLVFAFDFDALLFVDFVLDVVFFAGVFFVVFFAAFFSAMNVEKQEAGWLLKIMQNKFLIF